MPKLRLVKVLVQPVFVLDHGTHLQDFVEQPKEISAKDWPRYSGEQFPRELAEAQAALDVQDTESPAPSAPNRTARRAKGS
jgi:hypothetical protein